MRIFSSSLVNGAWVPVPEEADPPVRVSVRPSSECRGRPAPSRTRARWRVTKRRNEIQSRYGVGFVTADPGGEDHSANEKAGASLQETFPDSRTRDVPPSFPASGTVSRRIPYAAARAHAVATRTPIRPPV